jgi:hypothetical protein
VSALSGIDKPLTVPVIETRGKITQITVQPLPDTAQPAAPDISQITDIDQLRAMWQGASPDVREQIGRRVQEIRAQAAPEGGDAA